MWRATDDEMFPIPFIDLDLQGKTFLWAYMNRQEFCKFVLYSMYDTSGIFKVFQEYLKSKDGRVRSN